VEVKQLLNLITKESDEALEGKNISTLISLICKRGGWNKRGGGISFCGGWNFSKLVSVDSTFIREIRVLFIPILSQHAV
jgi:hypothetical protein